MARLLFARSDLTAAAHAFDAILSPNRDLRDPLTLPLYTAAIVCYARPFTDNEEVGSLPAKYSRFSTDAARLAHADALEIRHKFVAHSDFTARQPTIIPKGWEIEKGRNSLAVGSQVMTSILNRHVLVQLHDNAAEIVNGLHAEIEALEQELYGGMELPTLPFRLRLDEGL